MSKKTYSLLAVVLLLGFILTGCVRPASTPPVYTATSPAEFPFPVQEGTGVPTGATQAPGQKGAEAMTPQAGGGIIATVAPGEESGGGAPAEGPQSTPLETQQSGGGVPSEGQQVTQAPEVAAPSISSGPLPTVTVPGTYTLLRGEWPYCIARRFNVSPGALLSANGLNVNSKPSIGTVLTIPIGTTWDQGTRAWHSHPGTYTVASGNSVNSVACYYGDVDPSGIIAVNNLQPPYSLTAGQSLQIP